MKNVAFQGKERRQKIRPLHEEYCISRKRKKAKIKKSSCSCEKVILVWYDCSLIVTDMIG